MMTVNADMFARNNFLSEINIHQQIARHPYLVNLIGVITLSEPLCIITEYCEKGSLLLYLRERCEYMLKLEESGIDLEKDDIETLKYSIRLDMIVTYKQMLRFAIEICAGMEYLSGCGFIHRDLAARNIFVTAKDRLKIGDFGLCRAVDSDENYYKGHGGNLPVKWMSPEAISHFDFSLKSDV
uniref:Protein kinase domain-containing protein n=1 Tax=Ascaris lumbricoides TaxID=6252 RepID=A0A0M3IR11_ASCLU